MSDPRNQITEKFYETILSHIRDAVYVLNEHGEITWVNDVAIEEFDGGYERNDLVGASVTKILSEGDIQKCIILIQDLLKNNKQSGRCEVTLHTAEGGTLPAELQIGLLPLKDGEFQGTVGVARNISDQKRREEYLMVLNRILRHNLRNELNVILGHTDTLSADETLSYQQRESVSIIQEVTKELIQLSERAQTLETLIKREDTTLEKIDCVDRTAQMCRQYETKYPKATIETTFPRNVYIRGDDRLELALDNLLENAIEHADTDSPTVHVKITRVKKEQMAEIAVLDDGPGMPEQEFRVLNQQKESPLEHSNGLGLWLVKWIAATLDGDVVFQTRDTGGTDVRFKVPLICPEN